MRVQAGIEKSAVPSSATVLCMSIACKPHDVLDIFDILSVCVNVCEWLWLMPLILEARLQVLWRLFSGWPPPFPMETRGEWQTLGRCL